MANIKSSKKRIEVALKNREKNVAVKSEIKTAMKKALAFAQANETTELETALARVYKLCDKAVSKGVLHKNTAARRKSRLTIEINKIISK